MKKQIAKFFFEKVHGWTFVGKSAPEEVNRCMFVFAPHTSNWDFYFGVLCMMSLGVPIKVAIKKFWTQFPFGLVVKPLGGVGIDRARIQGKRQVEILADIFKKYDRIAFVITPEGSRSKRTKWKTGFYHIAQLADVPIVTFRADFSKRNCDFGPIFTKKDDLDYVMREMTQFYKDSIAYHPELFSPDIRYITPEA